MIELRKRNQGINLGTKMYSNKIISTLPNIGKKENTMIENESRSAVTVPALNPVLVNPEIASKYASPKSYPRECIWFATNNGIIGNATSRINAVIMSFLCDFDICFLKRFLTSASFINLKIFSPPAVEKPHPPMIITIIITANAAGFKLFSEIV